jgi:hypothetical protein
MELSKAPLLYAVRQKSQQQKMKINSISALVKLSGLEMEECLAGGDGSIQEPLMAMRAAPFSSDVPA